MTIMASKLRIALETKFQLPEVVKSWKWTFQAKENQNDVLGVKTPNCQKMQFRLQKGMKTYNCTFERKRI